MKTTTITFLFVFLAIGLFGQPGNEKVIFESNNIQLNKAFDWAKNKALSYAHNNSDPVGFWYEAALPNREAFCMRDVSHQAIGAEILGLSAHNYNMFLKFAENISFEKDYCSWWEINRYNKPAPVDYENDKDFWYNLPANFDVIYNAKRLYNWTGNKQYLTNKHLTNFYNLSLNEYVEHWDLGHNEVVTRNRSMHLAKTENGKKSRFGNKRGIPTYNEGGRGETLLGIDMTASLIAACKAYSEILNLTGDKQNAEKMHKLANLEKQFLDEFWWDKEKETYKSILYADNTFDYFMVGSNQAFLHYILYYNVLSDTNKIKSLVNEYIKNYSKLIVELKSYLPIIFYENGRSDIANKMIVDLCDSTNLRRDYPENSYTVIEHVTRGLMGLNADAATNTISVVSRLENENEWAEMKNIPVFSNTISLKHEGFTKTTVSNQRGPAFFLKVVFTGKHNNLFVNGQKLKATISKSGEFSFVTINISGGEKAIVSIQ